MSSEEHQLHFHDFHRSKKPILGLRSSSFTCDHRAPLRPVAIMASAMLAPCLAYGIMGNRVWPHSICMQLSRSRCWTRGLTSSHHFYSAQVLPCPDNRMRNDILSTCQIETSRILPTLPLIISSTGLNSNSAAQRLTHVHFPPK